MSLSLSNETSPYSMYLLWTASDPLPWAVHGNSWQILSPWQHHQRARWQVHLVWAQVWEQEVAAGLTLYPQISVIVKGEAHVLCCTQVMEVYTRSIHLLYRAANYFLQLYFSWNIIILITEMWKAISECKGVPKKSATSLHRNSNFIKTLKWWCIITEWLLILSKHKSNGVQ